MNVYDQIEDDTKTLSPKFAGVISESDAQSLLSAAFDQSTATSDQGADLYQNQEGNSDFKQVKQMFDGLIKMIIILRIRLVLQLKASCLAAMVRAMLFMMLNIFSIVVMAVNGFKLWNIQAVS